MEVSPDSNMEASSGSEQNQTGENNNNNNAGMYLLQILFGKLQD